MMILFTKLILDHGAEVILNQITLCAFIDCLRKIVKFGAEDALKILWTSMGELGCKKRSQM